MSTHDALLHAIRANPADDLPRLVYADWLDENGDPDRATFIRLQIETAKLPPFTPERDAAEGREQAVLAANRERWAGPLAGLIGQMPHQIAFRRGFVGEIELRNYEQWTTGGMPEFLNSPLVALTRLAFSSNDGDPLHSPDMVHDMLGHPPLEHLWSLQFNELVVQAGAMEVVVTHPRLCRLHTLGFWACDLTDLSVAELARSFVLPQVRSLGLTHDDLRDADVIALAGSPRLANLTGLNLTGNSWLTDAAAEAILASPHLAQLTRLDLPGCDRLSATGKAKLRDRFGGGVTLDP